jgi:hypothetical protein
MKDIFNPTFDIRDWFDPTITLPGWFDQEFSDGGLPPVLHCTLAAIEGPETASFKITSLELKQPFGRQFIESALSKQIREEDEEILGVISEFLFLEAA